MSEFRYARGRIEESVQFLSEEIKEFQSDYASKVLSDYQDDKKLQKLMDRTVENILTALIEVCGAVLAEEGIRAENYGEVLEKCSKFLGLSEGEQKNLSGLAIQRNRLAHRYLNFRWQAIKMYRDSKDVVLKLIQLILEREKKKR
ncbi:MAG TPA: HepT-like ribonuclease domain-containing protein [Candidatus Brocadiaceae bacterium]